METETYWRAKEIAEKLVELRRTLTHCNANHDFLPPLPALDQEMFQRHQKEIRADYEARIKVLEEEFETL